MDSLTVGRANLSLEGFIRSMGIEELVSVEESKVLLIS
jgi:hypothetical protein